MDAVQRRFPIHRQHFVEVVVLLVGDFLGILSPDGSLLVDGFFTVAYINGEGNVIRMTADDIFEFPLLQNIFGILFEGDDDVGSA